ncbi:hypothetical protein [Actinosynnema sp. NPDC020468]|uniref:hypothetical protein n=1 Tax=Actinosynnema sp. NPDC020468 TaxID=3154488 RepID=UPI0033F7E8A6
MLGERLDAIRREASAEGVTVVVDLHGKPVDLAFDRTALTMRPDDLAALVRGLVAQAAADALAEGIAVLTETVPAHLFGATSEERPPPPAVRRASW